MYTTTSLHGVGVTIRMIGLNFARVDTGTEAF